MAIHLNSEAPRPEGQGFHSSGANPAPLIPRTKVRGVGRRGKIKNKPVRFIVSACLAGIKCSYDGKHRLEPSIKRLVEIGTAMAVCPEMLGGSPTPRERCEIVEGSGRDVLCKKARVLTISGKDITNKMLTGAKKTLLIAKAFGAVKAIMKSGSPSCGFGQIHDGTFTGSLAKGSGVTSALLLKHKIRIYTEKDGRYAHE